MISGFTIVIRLWLWCFCLQWSYMLQFWDKIMFDTCLHLECGGREKWHSTESYIYIWTGQKQRNARNPKSLSIFKVGIRDSRGGGSLWHPIQHLYLEWWKVSWHRIPVSTFRLLKGVATSNPIPIFRLVKGATASNPMLMFRMMKGVTASNPTPVFRLMIEAAASNLIPTFCLPFESAASKEIRLECVPTLFFIASLRNWRI